MIIFKKIINFIFFKPERLFMFLPPLNYPSEVKYIYILRNFLIYFKIKKWKKLFLMIINGIDKYVELDENFLGPINLGNPHELSMKNLAEIIISLTKLTH